MDFESFKSSLLEFFLSDMEYGDEDVMEMFERLNGPDEILDYAQSLKLEGNALYKQRRYVCTFQKYIKAIKAICFSIQAKGGIELALKDLGISLNLNLAICAIKLDRFTEAMHLCSLVLKFDRQNIKALYRRAGAYVSLGNFGNALEDLIKAKEIQPNNKEVLEEFGGVRCLLRCHGLNYGEGKLDFRKTTLVGTTMDLEDKYEEKGKTLMKEYVMVGETSDCSSNNCSNAENNAAKMVVDDYEVVSEEKRKHKVPGKNSMEGEDCGNTINTQRYTFFNRQKSSSGLSIPKSNMQKLVNGQKVVFYHSFSQSVMTVRAVNRVKTHILKETSRDVGSREATISTNHEVFAETPNQIEICETTSSNEPPSNEVCITPGLSVREDNQTAPYPIKQVQMVEPHIHCDFTSPVVQQVFVFSSTSGQRRSKF